LIGDPVAATPGLDPHDDKLTAADVPALLLVVAAGAALDELDVPAAELLAPPLLLLLPLLPQPANAMTPTAAITAAQNRLRDP
jgi:hypothetical protein